jgi:hypothetical protein
MAGERELEYASRVAESAMSRSIRSIECASDGRSVPMYERNRHGVAREKVPLRTAPTAQRTHFQECTERTGNDELP